MKFPIGNPFLNVGRGILISILINATALYILYNIMSHRLITFFYHPVEVRIMGPNEVQKPALRIDHSKQTPVVMVDTATSPVPVVSVGVVNK